MDFEGAAWYYDNGADDDEDGTVGPFDFDKMKAMYKSGSVKDDTLVWSETGMDDWEEVALVPGLLAKLKPKKKTPPARSKRKKPPPKAAARRKSLERKDKDFPSLAPAPAPGASLAPGAWEERHTLDGTEYYYNTGNHELTWYVRIDAFN